MRSINEETINIDENNSVSINPAFILYQEIGTEKTINNRYRIDQFLGKGGFGIVFKGYDILLKTIIAIKFIDPALTLDEKKLHRIRREINITRKISDPGIIKIYSLEKYSEINFFVMEYIEGITLSKMLKDKGKLDWKEFKPLFLKILRIINILHKNDILHRDLKPENIMVLQNEEIKIVDFGLAKDIYDKEKTCVTGEFAGTAEFISPEQINGESLDQRSDIYQLGLVLFKTISGCHPFPSKTTMELLVKYISDKPKKITAFIKEVPHYLSFVIAKMLEKNRILRFNNCLEIISILERKKIKNITKLTSFLKKSRTKLIISILFILVFFSILFFITYGSKKFHEVNIINDTLIAKNRFGNILWKRNFSQYKIFKSFILRGTISPLSQNAKLNFLNITENSNSRYIACFLTNPKVAVLRTDVSIGSNNFDNRIAFISSKGKTIINKPLSEYFSLQTYGLSKMFRVNKINIEDFDKDSNKDALITLSHSQGMYPYAMVFFNKTSPFHLYTSPGAIQNYRVLRADKSGIKLSIFGIANLVSGLKFFAVIDLNKHIFGIPNLKSETSANFNGFQIYLPTKTELIEDTWKKNGMAKFKDTITGETIIINKNYHVIVKKGDSVLKYIDKKETLFEIYRLINMIFQEKVKFKNFAKALELTEKALKININNPYLRSALYYFKGNLEVNSGFLIKGKKSLEKGLQLYPYNQRIENKLIELPYLSGYPLGSIDLLEKEFSNSLHFWGLAYGTDLFKAYMYLSSGMFQKTEEYFSKMINNTNLLKFSLLSTLNLFKGDYKKAEKLLKDGESIRRSHLSIAEYRLLHARTLIINNSNMDKAEFYLNDILKYSLKYKHLTELSIAYILAKKGQLNEAEKLADRGMKNLKKISKGNLLTRFWLFYDTFIYGKTMELLGNNTEAIKGFKECIKANPYTDLAKRAGIKVTILQNN